MFGTIGGANMEEDEFIARIIARETNDDPSSANWERYLPAARELLSRFDMRPRRQLRIGGGLLG